jgi:hypothetical protein
LGLLASANSDGWNTVGVMLILSKMNHIQKQANKRPSRLGKSCLVWMGVGNLTETLVTLTFHFCTIIFPIEGGQRMKLGNFLIYERSVLGRGGH